MGRRCYRIGAGGAALLAFAVLAEWAAGWGLPGTPPPERRIENRVHPTRGWMPLPDQAKTLWNGRRFETNALGYRERPLGPKPPGERRVWFVGDSVTMGVEVEAEETFVRRVEAALRKEGVPARAVNGGVYGYGLDQARALLAEDWPAVAPDAVVLVFCPNDVPGVLPERRGTIPAWLAAPADLFARTNLFRRACWIRERAHRAEARRLGTGASLLADEVEEMLWAGLWKGRGDYAAAARQVAACAGVARGRGVPFLCVLAPVRLQFREGLFPSQEGSHVPQERLRCDPALAGVDCLDLWEPFGDGGGERLFSDHTHLSPEGHAAAAAAIAGRIREWMR